MEIRHVPLTVRETRETEDTGIVEAYTSVFDTEYAVGPFGMRETIRAGAFENSIAERPSIPVFWQHDHEVRGYPIGTATSEEDDHGLFNRAEIWLDDPKARAVYRSLDAGSIREWSIGFRAVETRDEGEGLESVLDADLREVSAVLLGANPDTDTVSVRFLSPDEVAEMKARADEQEDEGEDQPEPVEGAERLPLHRWLKGNV